MTEKTELSLAKALVDSIVSMATGLGFKKTKEVTTQVAPTKQAPKQRTRTVITLERSYGVEPEDEDGWRTESMTLEFTDASIKDAVAAYVAAQKNPVSVKEQEDYLGDQEFDTTILDNHELQPVMQDLIGRCGAVALGGSMSESEFNAGVTLGIGKMLSKDGEDPELSGINIDIGVDGPASVNS